MNAPITKCCQSQTKFPQPLSLHTWITSSLFNPSQQSLLIFYHSCLSNYIILITSEIIVSFEKPNLCLISQIHSFRHPHPSLSRLLVHVNLNEVNLCFKSDIVRPWHGVQLTTGQYVVCHGSYNSLHRVCIVDGDGKVIRSYGDWCGSDIDQLYLPSHVAVDKDSQFIFVADCFNARVMLLSPTLKFVRYYRKGNIRPCRLHLDHSTRRLYVGESFGAVVVIQL